MACMTSHNTDYLTHREECQNVFLTNKRAVHIMWAVIVVTLGVVGSSVAWALATTASLSRLESVSTTQADDINLLRATYASIDNKLDRLMLMRQAK